MYSLGGMTEEIGGVGGDKTTIRIYFMEETIFNKRKLENRNI